MKNKESVSGKKQSAALKDLKSKKNPKGGGQETISLPGRYPGSSLGTKTIPGGATIK
jgi:hypothetical protein